MAFNFVSFPSQVILANTSKLALGTIRNFQRREYEVFHWKINQFSLLSESAGTYYESPRFDFRGHRSYLKFYPNGMEDNKKGFFALFFYSPDYNDSCCVHLTMGLKTQSGRVEKRFSKYITFSDSSGFGTSDFILRSKFIEQKEELAPSDCLTFVIFLSPDAHELIRDVADPTETGQAEDKDGEEKSEKKGGEKALGDMAKLLTSGNRSDTTIVIEGTEYKVHSCILAARTPVFAAMFEHDTIEKMTRKITITDCEPATFEEFLRYIYTGSVQNLTAQNAFGLYRMADKYLVKDLKEVCKQCIEKNLSIETFCEVIQLAQMCQDHDLLETAFDYCAMHVRRIIRSVEWQRYIKENPIEANEILIRSFGPL